MSNVFTLGIISGNLTKVFGQNNDTCRFLPTYFGFKEIILIWNVHFVHVIPYLHRYLIWFFYEKSGEMINNAFRYQNVFTCISRLDTKRCCLLDKKLTNTISKSDSNSRLFKTKGKHCQPVCSDIHGICNLNQDLKNFCSICLHFDASLRFYQTSEDF